MLTNIENAFSRIVRLSFIYYHLIDRFSNKEKREQHKGEILGRGQAVAAAARALHKFNMDRRNVFGLQNYFASRWVLRHRL